MRRIASLLAGFPWISELWRTMESHITQIVPSSSWNWKVSRWFSHSNCAKTLQKTGQKASIRFNQLICLLSSRFSSFLHDPHVRPVLTPVRSWHPVATPEHRHLFGGGMVSMFGAIQLEELNWSPGCSHKSHYFDLFRSLDWIWCFSEVIEFIKVWDSSGLRSLLWCSMSWTSKLFRLQVEVITNPDNVSVAVVDFEVGEMAHAGRWKLGFVRKKSMDFHRGVDLMATENCENDI